MISRCGPTWSTAGTGAPAATCRAAVATVWAGAAAGSTSHAAASRHPSRRQRATADAWPCVGHGRLRVAARGVRGGTDAGTIGARSGCRNQTIAPVSRPDGVPGTPYLMERLPDTGAAMNAGHVSPPARWPLGAALAYTAFPVYGSLIPFRWTPQPIGDAAASFGALLRGPLTVASRADFAANVLLALPLALLWLAAVVAVLRLRRPWAVGLAAVAVWVACVALALVLEFSQLFFSGREPALSDCVAQALGAALGVGAWFAVPASFWQRSTSPHGAWRRAFGAYLACVVLYGVLPLDLTVSRSEIAAKWTQGLVNPVPFLAWQGRPLAGLTDFVLDAAIWGLAAWLARRARGGSLGTAGWALVAVAAALEGAQLLVLSRVVDTTDIVAAAVGVLAVGLIPDAAGDRRARFGRLALPGLAALALLALHTWPFDFATDTQALRARLDTLSAIPFASYATNTELYLVTNVLRRVAQFAAFAAVCLWAARPWHLSRTSATVVVATTAAALAAAIEGLQVFLPQRVVDTGDVLIAAVVGALTAGLWPGATAATASRAGQAAGRDAAAASRVSALRPPGGRDDPARLDRRWAIAVSLAVLAAAVGVAYVPQVPYNLRELLAPGGVPWPAVTVTAAALALFGVPSWLARVAVPRPAVPVAATVGGLLGVPLVLAVLLFAGAPRESVYDVVGSPVLGIGAAVETVGRLAVLMLGFVWSLALGHALHGGLLRPGQRGASVSHLLLHGCWVVPLWHQVVVRWAGTDNLTELMAGGGGAMATACLLGYATVLGATGSVIHRMLREPRWGRAGAAIAMLAASTLLGWALLAAGTESAVVKYGRVFSTLQFLLSTDRSVYVEGASLALRFVLAHLALSGLSAAGVLVAAALPAVRRR
ncbi:VanZ family protein [Calidifontimicrobium sp. SYSU G02091]|uniref:VanZ family protein n=1 Tax=Calidifontimicrobium sp. SYSU G02091 TaxID=2926421 RepID=UPI001F53B211|nr:VanZ family protein [Calidifontimicrobium sp. SYSU G02091]MCI1191738.1 VanZ family protein [Calidifontimicrobium sp. SYSU G02091]